MNPLAGILSEARNSTAFFKFCGPRKLRFLIRSLLFYPTHCCWEYSIKWTANLSKTVPPNKQGRNAVAYAPS
ncbi:hypothetical protein K1719_010730 [Acacia pycnantha]|nr:hypothetical protein K1719_010730 [Acacia pycnantha]